MRNRKDAQSSLATATEQRNKQNKAFVEATDDLKQDVAAITKAVQLLGGSDFSLINKVKWNNIDENISNSKLIVFIFSHSSSIFFTF